MWGRAHYNNLNEASKRKQFSANVIREFKDVFPLVETAKCKCDRHKAGCGCLGDSFLTNARVNHCSQGTLFVKYSYTSQRQWD